MRNSNKKNICREGLKEFFNKFHRQVKKRLEKFKQFSKFGEDSIRFDFYYTAIETFELDPVDLRLEEPIPSSQFMKKEEQQEAKPGRYSYKPKIDLRIDRSEPKDLPFDILVEFAFFRRTEKSEMQDRSGRHGKLMNEMFRLALFKENRYFSKYCCLLILVTDKEMLKYGRNKIGRKAEPISKEYKLDSEYLNKFPKSVKEKIKTRYKEKADELDIIPTANTIYEKEEEKEEIGKWKTWIWEIKYQKK